MEKAAKGELRQTRQTPAATGGTEADGKAQAGMAQAGGKNDPEIELLRQLMPSEEEVRELTANTDPETFLKDLGDMASQMGMSGGGGTPSDEVAKLAQAFKLSDSLKLKPGVHPDAAAMDQAHELLQSSPFLKAKVEEAMRDPAQMRKMMEAHPDMRSKMQEAQHLIQQEPEWPQIQRKLQQAQHDPVLMAQLRAELSQKRDAEVDPARRQKMQHELDGLEEIARVTAAAADAADAAKKPEAAA